MLKRSFRNQNVRAVEFGVRGARVAITGRHLLVGLICAMALRPIMSFATGCLDGYVDTFSDGVVAPWVDVSTGGCGSVSEVGGKLQLSKPSGCVGFAAVNLGSSVLCGDFEVEIDYQLTFPGVSTAGGSIQGMQIRVSGSDDLVAGAERYRESANSCVPNSDSYKFYTTIPGCATNAIYYPSTDTQGRFRITRHGATVQGYYWNGTTWVLGMTRPITTADLYIRLQSGTNNSYTAPTSGTFDNLIVRSGAALTNACIVDRSDDFADGVLDPSWVPNGCGAVSEVGGELLLDKFACNGSVGFDMNPAQRPICGDFDIQIDFRLTNFSANNYGRYASLRVSDVSNGSNRAVIERYAENPPYCAPATQLYKAWINNSDNCSPEVAWQSTPDISGKFRIQRVGNQLNLYYWSGSWILLKAGTWVTGKVIMGVYTGTTPLTGTASQAFFDNLSIQSQDPTGVGSTPSASPQLLRVYPNPFSSTTRIAFNAPDNGEAIVLEIIDVGGRKIKTLMRGRLSEGQTAIGWDGTDNRGHKVGSGIYFCRLESFSQHVIQKIVLLR
jgi:hypothetical protein